jgi:DNA adenine methylase
MHPLIKWPGGKANEIDKIANLIPQHSRYIEPFFGGGALFFYLRPAKASVNDISNCLVEFYSLVKKQDKALYDLLLCYNDSFANVISTCSGNYDEIIRIYNSLKTESMDKASLTSEVSELTNGFSERINFDFRERLLLDEKEFSD